MNGGTQKFHTSLPPNLHAIKKEIEGYARELGLDFFNVIFEVLDWNQLNEVAAFGGFPNRYPHWQFGMEYEKLSKSYAYGLSKIYEMVINNDPCYAYLLHSNSILDQKLVMAHVYAHCDFFKNNVYFAHTNRKMMNEMANHRTKILNYIDKYGIDSVEEFIDACHSIDNLIDYHAPAIKRRGFVVSEENQIPLDRRTAKKFRVSKPYLDSYVNPPDFLEEQKQWLEKESNKEHHFPLNPEKDVMLFILENAPLRSWEREVLSIIREEAYYFAPQGQTKILNEGWACVVPDTYVFTNKGIIKISELVDKIVEFRVHDGENVQRSIDRAVFQDRDTIKIKTKRGFEIEGSATHQILMNDNHSWKRLDELKLGDEISLGYGSNLWSKDYVRLDFNIEHRMTLNDVAMLANVNVSTVIRHKKGEFSSRSAERIDNLLLQYDNHINKFSFNQNKRKDVVIPNILDENLASLLGYLVGDGHVSSVKRVIGLTTGDEQQAIRFADLVYELFGIEAEIKKDENRFRVLFSSENIREFLVYMGLTEGFSARQKTIPDMILKSPKSVVSAFIRALFDCDGYAGDAGVILSTSSVEMSKLIQIALLNFGILSRRRPQPHDIWHVHITGNSAKKFEEEIGFNLLRKRNSLNKYLCDRQWFKEEDTMDEIVSIEKGKSDVYDITVEKTHRYLAHGFINHNSYWHSTIMTQKALHPSELIDYADHHSGTVATHGNRLNPYKMGLTLLKDIEDRWNRGKFGREYNECTDMVKRRQWDKKLGLGREKIFEVRKLYNDVTLIDEFLTPEFCAENKLFVYSYDYSASEFEIVTREFEKIKKQFLFQLTNFGYPIIHVVDGNYENKGELLLEHTHEGVDLKSDWTEETLKNLFKLWKRPVNIQTVVDGVKKIVGFDGSQMVDKRI